MKQNSTSTLRAATVTYWSTFNHARHEADVARVHAFQALVRDAEDLGAITDDRVTEAYGGRGWAPAPVCCECGARDDSNVLFGPAHELSLCATCVAKANGFNAHEPPAAPKPGLFSRLFKGA
jgi:hypothetical protein